MAWETRSGGEGRYYTRSKRVGDRVVREYVGTGDVAELIALQDEQRRELRKMKQMSEEIAFREKVAPIEQMAKDVENLVQLLDTELERNLNETGIYFHRGSWRKRRTG